jgi:hypothetical protein
MQYNIDATHVALGVKPVRVHVAQGVSLDDARMVVARALGAYGWTVAGDFRPAKELAITTYRVFHDAEFDEVRAAQIM